MRIATRNLNHRAGQFFKLEVASAGCALDVDLIAFSEFALRNTSEEDEFLRLLAAGGLGQFVSSAALSGGTRGTRVLVASRLPIERQELDFPPAVDIHVVANAVAVRVPRLSLKVIALRVPYYQGAQARDLTLSCWEWLEATAAAHADQPCVILGDLKVSMTSGPGRGGTYLRGLLSNG